jgi:hypothetical protein
MYRAVLSLQSRLIGPDGSLRRAYRRVVDYPISEIRRNPRDVGAWIDLVERERRAGRLPGRTAALAEAHEIQRDGSSACFSMRSHGLEARFSTTRLVTP